MAQYACKIQEYPLTFAKVLGTVLEANPPMAPRGTYASNMEHLYVCIYIFIIIQNKLLYIYDIIIYIILKK